MPPSLPPDQLQVTVVSPASQCIVGEVGGP